MSDEQANPQEPHEEEEELDLESQLDAVLSQLQALEPDLLPGPTKPPEPVIAQPAVEEPAQAPPPSESSVTPVEAEAVGVDPQGSDNPQGIGDQLDTLITQQIDQEIDAGQIPDSPDDRAAQPAEAAGSTDDPDAEAVASELGQDENEADLSAQQIDALISQGIEQQVDEALSSTTEEVVIEDVAEVDPGEAAVGVDPISAEPSSPSPQEQSTAAKLDGLLNQQIDQQIDDAQANESIPEASATIAAGDEAVVSEVSSSPTDEETEDTSTGQQIDEILAQLAGQLDEGDAEDTSEAESEGVDAVESAADEDDSLNVEQIDALLAQEAEQTVSDEFETPTEIQAMEGLQVSPDAPADAMADIDEGIDSSVEASASPAEAEQHAGGFTAGAGDVAAEIDDQPENKPRVPRAAHITPESNKQGLVQRVVVCKHALWRTCFVINRPLEKVPGPVRDAIGYFALAHVMFGSVLILGKLVGIV